MIKKNVQSGIPNSNFDQLSIKGGGGTGIFFYIKANEWMM